MSDAATAAPAAPKKSKTKLLIIAAIAVVLLAGGGGAFFVLKKKAHDAEVAQASDEEDESPAKAKKKKKKKAAETAAIFVPLDQFTLNLADTDADRYAQVAVVFEVSDKKVDELIKAQLPAVRNQILLLLSSKTAKELLSIEGKQRLAEEIAKATAERLDTEAIDNVLFSQFIVQ